MDKVTQQIRDMYNNYPYPKRDHTYIENLLDSAKNSERLLFNYSRSLELITGNSAKHSLRVLNAGCGTGENFIFQAIMEPKIEFMFLDVTPGSVKKVEDYIAYFELKNVEVMEGDLMQLDLYLGDNYNNYFDYIISTGVLHHLPSPETGLINLRKKLKPDGLMYLMLYGKHGRYEINLMQHLLNTFQPDRSLFDDRIEIMKEIIEYLRNSKARHRLKTSPSMENYLAFQSYKLEELVDAFLHINENVYSVKNIFDFVAAADMQFLCFYDEPTWRRLQGAPEKLQRRIASLPDLDRYLILEDLDGYKRIQSFYCADVKFTRELPAFDEVVNCKINTWPESGLVKEDNGQQGNNLFWRFLTADSLENNYRDYRVPLTKLAADIALFCQKGINFHQLVKKIKKKYKTTNMEVLADLKYLHEHKVVYLVRK